MATCLICLGAGAGGSPPYHRGCLKRLFGAGRPPRLELREDRLVEVALQMVGRQSISGVARKLSLGLADDRRTLRVAVRGAGYILKPPAEPYPALPANELLSMRIAELAGLGVPACGLVPLEEGALAYLVRRFDRREDGSKRALEDFCQLSGLPPKDKYAGSYERCAKVVRRHATAPEIEVRALFHQILVAWWIGDGDLHLKNLSLLRGDDGRYRLSPAYDVVSTRVYLPVDRLALTLQGKRARIDRGVWLRFSEAIGLRAAAAISVISRVLDAFEPACEKVEASPLPEPLRERYRARLEASTAALRSE